MSLYQLAQIQDPDALSFWFVAFVVLYSFGIIVSATHLALLVRPIYQAGGRWHYSDVLLGVTGCILWPVTILYYSFFAVSKSLYSRSAIREAGIVVLDEIEVESKMRLGGDELGCDELKMIQKQAEERRSLNQHTKESTVFPTQKTRTSDLVIISALHFLAFAVFCGIMGLEIPGGAFALAGILNASIYVRERLSWRHHPLLPPAIGEAVSPMWPETPLHLEKFGTTPITAGKLDAKFYGRVVKAKNGEIVNPDEWCVFLAKDNAFALTLPNYLQNCKELGADAEQIAAVERLIARVQQWRAANQNRCKIPDAKGDELLDQSQTPQAPKSALADSFDPSRTA